jgi:hypothetical protein
MMEQVRTGREMYVAYISKQIDILTFTGKYGRKPGRTVDKIARSLIGM